MFNINKIITMNVNSKVKSILWEYYDTRNSRELLVIRYWNKYYWVNITEDQIKKILNSETINSIIREWYEIQSVEKQFEASINTQNNRKKSYNDYKKKFAHLNKISELRF